MFCNEAIRQIICGGNFWRQGMSNCKGFHLSNDQRSIYATYYGTLGRVCRQGRVWGCGELSISEMVSLQTSWSILRWKLTNPVLGFLLNKLRQQREELFALGIRKNRQECPLVRIVRIEQELCFSTRLNEEHLQCSWSTST